MKRLSKNILKVVSSVALSFLVGCSAVPTHKTSAVALSTPPQVQRLDYSEYNDAEFSAFLLKYTKFSAKLTSAYLAEYNDGKTNTVLSPLSIFNALALAVECTNGNTRQQILDRLDMTYEQVHACTKKFISMQTRERKDDRGKLITREMLSNSIWVDDGLPTQRDCIEELANEYYCYPYSVDFANTQSANADIRNFIKNKTNGLIDKDFGIPAETVFALINTLYLKDVWLESGTKLPKVSLPFTSADGATAVRNLLSTGHQFGRAYHAEDYSSFFAKTDHDYYLKFIVPNEVEDLSRILTEQTFECVSSIDYTAENTEEVVYRTSCKFPTFTAESGRDVKGVFEKSLGITDIFSPSLADFSKLSSVKTYCSKLVHASKLKVDDIGIEGAAVTIMLGDVSSAPPKKVIYEDFVVDKAFGYILTDSYGIPLFAGVVNK